MVLGHDVGISLADTYKENFELEWLINRFYMEWHSRAKNHTKEWENLKCPCFLARLSILGKLGLIIDSQINFTNPGSLGPMTKKQAIAAASPGLDGISLRVKFKQRVSF